MPSVRMSLIRASGAVLVLPTLFLAGCVHSLCGNKWNAWQKRATSQELVAAHPHSENPSSDDAQASTDRLELPTWQRPSAELAPVPAASVPTAVKPASVQRDAVQRDSTDEVNAVTAQHARRENVNDHLETSLSDASPIAPIGQLLGNESNSNAANQPPVDLTRSLAPTQIPSRDTQLASASELVGFKPPQTETNRPVTPAVATSDVTLELRIENIRTNQGPVKVAVFVDAPLFPKREGVWKAIELSDKDSVALAGLSVNRPCAVAVFQDLDGNGELTKNLRGIPTEPCAFSNGALIKRGPPKFSEAALTPGSASSPLRTVIKLP